MNSDENDYRVALDVLLAHRYRYYVLCTPTISDYSYDNLERDLKAMEEATGHTDAFSPSITVGSDAARHYPKHIQEMFNGKVM